MKRPGSGALAEHDGRCFMALLDMCHFLVDQITKEFDFPDVNAASQLRATNTQMSAKLTASMYSYWDSAPAGPGVYQMLREWVTEDYKQGAGRHKRGAQGGADGMARVLYLVAENEVQHWPRQRLTGKFYFAKETASGASIMVDQQVRSAARRPRACATPRLPPPRFATPRRPASPVLALLLPEYRPCLLQLEKVYCVVGISTSIGDIMRAGGRTELCGSPLLITLLPFMGKIVYDGTLRGAPPCSEPDFARRLLSVAEAAEAAGTVLTELPKPTIAPLIGKRVLISGLVGRPELNGTHGTAVVWSEERGRYGVRLPGGADVLLKPANLEAAKDQSADGSRGAAEAASVSAGLSAVEARVRSSLKAMAPMSGDGGFWTFRRMGYTEAENPQHQIVVISGVGMPVEVGGGMPFVGCKALQPTADEILTAIESASRCAGAKPKAVAVDEKSIIERLQLVLEPTGVHCGYYPPPSQEELANMGGPAASHSGFAPPQ